MSCSSAFGDNGIVYSRLQLISTALPLHLYTRNAIFAERRERSEANNRVLFEIPRYLYIYI